MQDVFDLEFQFDSYVRMYGYDRLGLTDKELSFLKHALSYGINTGASLMTEGQVFVDKGILPFELVNGGLNQLVNGALDVLQTMPVVNKHGGKGGGSW